MSESKEAGTECHLKVKIEWLGGVQVNQTTRESVVAQRLNNGLLHQIEDAIGIGPARREPDSYAYNGHDDPFPEFFQMAEQRHGVRLLSQH